jgi:uncharacterized protein
MAVAQDLLRRVQREFALKLDGIHGEAHWARVRRNGLLLAEQTGADSHLVELFAYLHDSKRLNDGWDLEHGQRAADFARSLQDSLLFLAEDDLELLAYACAHHSEGLTDAHVTVQTCWDADRLDLGRIGIEPDPRHLCTAAAQDSAMIARALRQSQTSA